MTRSKLVITCLNGIGSRGDAVNKLYHPEHPETSEGTDTYLSHLLIRERDRILRGIPFNLRPDYVPLYGIGGPGNAEDRVLSQVTNVLEPNDVWLAVGYSYGAYDTHKMIKHFWAERGLKAPCPWIGFCSVDMDWIGSAILRPFQRLGLKSAPVNFGYNIYQRTSWPGGTDVTFKVIQDNTVNAEPNFQPRSFSIEVPFPNHHGVDTSVFAQGAIGFSLKAAIAEVMARRAKGDDDATPHS